MMTTNEFNRRVYQAMKVGFISLPIILLLALSVVVAGVIAPALGGVLVLTLVGFLVYKVWREGK